MMIILKRTRVEVNLIMLSFVIKLLYLPDTITAMIKPTFYKKAITFTVISGSVLFFPLLIAYIAVSGGHFPSWIMDLLGLFFGPFCQQVSANGYVAKFFDFVLLKRKKILTPEEKKEKKENAESVGLIIGLIAAIAFSIAQIALHTIPLANTIGSVAGSILLCLTSPSTFGGLGNRTGRLIDFFRNNLTRKNIFRKKSINYVLGVGLGIAAGVALTAAIIAASSATFGILPAILFTIGGISACASAGGYIGRAADFLLGNRTAFHAASDALHGLPPPKESLQDRATPENKGTLIGVGIGITAGIIIGGLIIAGIVTLPFFGAGLPKIALGVLLLVSLTSAGGGIGNRIGHAWPETKTTPKNISPPRLQKTCSYSKILKPKLPQKKREVIKGYLEETQSEWIKELSNHNNSYSKASLFKSSKSIQRKTDESPGKTAQYSHQDGEFSQPACVF
jgi:hypothetical protein